jgi:ribosome maturation factor RimP
VGPGPAFFCGFLRPFCSPEDPAGCLEFTGLQVSRRLQKDAIMALAVPLATELGLEVLEIELGGDASRQIVRILLDAERPVTVADCEAVSRRLNDVLDAHDDEDAKSGQYMLEVSSPGVNRPLIRPEHFRRVVGSRVRLKLTRAAALPDGETVAGAERPVGRTLLGRLEHADDDGVKLAADDGRLLDVAYANVDRANLEYEFPETGPPGKRGKSGKQRR